MFTELADMQAEGDTEGVKRGIVGGTNQILFFMIPFALYLMVFALPLVTLYHAGAFTMDNVNSIATYMTVLAFALPVYGVNTYLQKIFSSLRKMGVFAAFNFVAGAAQIALTMFGASNVERFPIEIIAVAEVLFYVVADVCLFVYLRRRLGPFGLRSVAKACARGLVFGGLGAAAGGGVLFALQMFVAPLSGSIPQALAYVLASGIVALVVTFGLSIKLRAGSRVAAFVGSIVGKVKGKLGRGSCLRGRKRAQGRCCVELHQLRYLSAVAHCGSAAKAAEELYVSKQAVSKAIRSLEHETGFELFDRDDGMRLTENGRVSIIPCSRRSRGSCASWTRSTSYRASAGRGRAADSNRWPSRSSRSRSITYFSTRVTKRWRSSTSSSYRTPGCSVSTFKMSDTAILNALEEEAIDLGFVHGTYKRPGIRLVPLGPVETRVITLRSNPFGRRASVRIADLHAKGFPSEAGRLCIRPSARICEHETGFVSAGRFGDPRRRDAPYRKRPRDPRSRRRGAARAGRDRPVRPSAQDGRRGRRNRSPSRSSRSRSTTCSSTTGTKRWRSSTSSPPARPAAPSRRSRCPTPPS